MPGNEVGDGVHNFFGQESLPRGGQHSQVIDGNWPGLRNSLLVGNQRQINASANPGLRNYNVQQSDLERGHGVPSSQLPQGLNFMQSTVGPEVGRSLSQSQHPDLGSYMHGQQVFQTTQYGNNFVGMDTESDRHNLMPKGFSVPASQLGTGPEPYNKNLMRLETNHSSVNYNLFGGQQQMSGTNHGILQSQLRQQSGIGDMQLLQQQVMLKRLQELQRQHVQKQQQEEREQSSVNHASAIVNQMTGGHSTALINGIPAQDGSNYLWQSETVASKNNWLQRGSSPALQRSSAGQMISPQHSQALRMMGVAPEQVHQSFYGIPVSGTRENSGQYTDAQMGKHPVQQISACNDSLSGNQYATFPDQLSKQEEALSSGQLYEKNIFGHTASQILNSEQNLGNFHRATQRESPSVQNVNERQEFTNLSDQLHEKTSTPVASSQNMATLDPTEERILFGSDDSVWDVFGKSDGTDPAFPSLSSGTWSALMQSAVAETSSSMGTQEEWSGLTSFNAETQTGNQHTSNLGHSSFQQTFTQGSNVFRNVTISSDVESNGKSLFGSWTQQQSSPSNRPKAEGTIDFKVDAVHNFSIEKKHVESTAGGPQVNREDPTIDNSFSARPNISNVRANSLYSQQLLHSNNLDFWKHVDSSVSSTQNIMSRDYQHNMGSSSINLAFSNEGAAEKHEVDDSNRKENSSDSFHSNASRHASAGVSLRENAWSNAGDSCSLPGGKGTLINQVGRRHPGIRKFQYHPMGDMDVDEHSSYASNKTAHPQAIHPPASIGLKGPNQGYFGQSTSSGEKMLVDKVDHYEHGPVRNLSSPKQCLSSEVNGAVNSEGAVDHSQQIQSSNSRSFGLQLAPPSQQMLTNDQASSLQSSVQPENSFSATNVSSGHSLQSGNLSTLYNIQKNKSEAFIGGFPYPGNHFQNQLNDENQPITPQQPPNLSYMPGMQSKPVYLSCDNNAAPASLSGKSGSAHENDPALSAEASQPNNAVESHAVPFVQKFPMLETAQVSDLSAITGMAQKGPMSKLSHNLRYTALSQHPLRTQAVGSSNSCSQPNNFEQTNSGALKPETHGQTRMGGLCESAAYNSQGTGEADSANESTLQHLSSETDSAQVTASASQGRLSIENHLSEVSTSNPRLSENDIGGISHSLKPNNTPQNLSLPNHLQTKNAESDVGIGIAKRFKGPDDSNDHQPVASRESQQSYGYSAVTKASSMNPPSLPSADSRMTGFSPEAGVNQNANLPTKDMLTFGMNDLQRLTGSYNPAIIRGGRPQVSPQMAPSWFDQYGALKNGQVLPMYDAHRAIAAKNLEEPNIVGRASGKSFACNFMEKNSAIEANHLGNAQQTSNLTMAVTEPIPSSQLLPPQATAKSLAVGPKKRKSYTTESLPWFKEVVQGSRRLQDISMAEVEWARATNRLIEKVENDSDIIHDVPQPVRSKRRLILTTQHMQQLLHPPGASTFSADARTSYQNVVYFIARLALGDACSSISLSGKDSLPHDNGNLLSEKVKESGRTGETDICEVAKNFIDRAKKLEDDLLRLEKGVSVLDLRLECQDLEKFSVINRFAKFHSRNQADGAETSLSSDANASLQKPCPQRYVSAVQMPRNIPDRVQCLSL